MRAAVMQALRKIFEEMQVHGVPSGIYDAAKVLIEAEFGPPALLLFVQRCGFSHENGGRWRLQPSATMMVKMLYEIDS